MNIVSNSQYYANFNNINLKNNPNFKQVKPKISILKTSAPSLPPISAMVIPIPAVLNSHNVCKVVPKELDPVSNITQNIVDSYKGRSFTHFDKDNARLSEEANAEVLPIKKDISEEVVCISNFDEPYGTIAGSSTLDKSIYTEKLAQCAALAVVDRAHNTQSLIHVFPGYEEKENIQIINHILKYSNSKDLEISIIPGYAPATACTIQFLLDTIKVLKPNVVPKLYNFPSDIGIFSRGVILKNGKVYSCNVDDVTNRKVNPKENITYCKYTEPKLSNAYEVEKPLRETAFAHQYDKNEFKKWASENNLKLKFINSGYEAAFYDAGGKLVRTVVKDYRTDDNSVSSDIRELYDEDGNFIETIRYHKD